MSPTSASPFSFDLIWGDRCWTLLPSMTFFELAQCPFQICLSEKSFWTSGHFKFEYLPAVSLVYLPTMIRNNNSNILLIHLWYFHCFSHWNRNARPKERWQNSPLSNFLSSHCWVVLHASLSVHRQKEVSQHLHKNKLSICWTEEVLSITY